MHPFLKNPIPAGNQKVRDKNTFIYEPKTVATIIDSRWCEVRQRSHTAFERPWQSLRWIRPSVGPIVRTKCLTASRFTWVAMLRVRI